MLLTSWRCKSNQPSVPVTHRRTCDVQARSSMQAPTSSAASQRLGLGRIDAPIAAAPNRSVGTLVTGGSLGSLGAQRNTAASLWIQSRSAKELAAAVKTLAGRVIKAVGRRKKEQAILKLYAVLSQVSMAHFPG